MSILRNDRNVDPRNHTTHTQAFQAQTIQKFAKVKESAARQLNNAQEYDPSKQNLLLVHIIRVESSNANLKRPSNVYEYLLETISNNSKIEQPNTTI